MNPLLLFVFLTTNLLTLVASLSVLMLAFWQQFGDAIGHAVVQFLAGISFYNLTVILLIVGIILAYPPDLSLIIKNLTIMSFAFGVISTFSLVITMAGVMKQAWQVIARAGVVGIVVMQWPLWTRGFFVNSRPPFLMDEYTDVGLIAAATGLLFIVMTIIAIWIYRRRIGQPAMLAGLVLLLGAQALTLFNPVLREVGFPSLIAIIASAVLGYNLMRMRLFGPLMAQSEQVAAIKEIARVITRSDSEVALLNSIAEQSRHILRTDLCLILMRTEESMLVVCTQSGGSDSLLGHIEPLGEGLNGRVFETQQPMRLADYHTWDGRLKDLSNMAFYASLSVPLIHHYDVVGVLAVHELEPGRLFNDQEQAVLEILAPQAAVAIVNAELRQRIDALQQYNGANWANNQPVPKQ